MANQTSFLPPKKNSISSFLGSPRLFNGLLSPKSTTENQEANLTSPTSILDAIFGNPFGYDNRSLPKSPLPSPEINKSAIGLALIDSLNDEKNDPNLPNFSKPISRMALFGSKLNAVQIPAINPSPSADFGIRTKNCQLLTQFSDGPPAKDKDSFTRHLSLKEMELSEDYTCVITHGPNPKTTHIFDDCIVEDIKISESDCVSSSESVDFLSFCPACKDNLGKREALATMRADASR